MVPIMPRLILNIREMHGRGTQGRLRSIDTAFGLSASHPIATRNAVSAVVFEEGARESWAMLEAQDDEEIQLEVIQVGGRSR